MHILIEGGDAVGKGLVTDTVCQHLADEFTDVRKVREPGGSPLGESIRSILLSPQMSYNLEVQRLLFLAARVDLFDTVVKDRINVPGFATVSDRGFLSTLVYNVDSSEVAIETLDHHNRLMSWPDVILLVDADSDVIYSRMNSRVSSEPDGITELKSLEGIQKRQRDYLNAIETVLDYLYSKGYGIDYKQFRASDSSAKIVRSENGKNASSIKVVHFINDGDVDVLLDSIKKALA